jgi:hypothetical protein
VLTHRERLRHLAGLEHGTAPLSRRRVARIGPEETSDPGRRPGEPQQQPNGGRLAGTVRTEERRHLPGKKGEVERVERHHLAVAPEALRHPAQLGRRPTFVGANPAGRTVSFRHHVVSGLHRSSSIVATSLAREASPSPVRVVRSRG